MHLINLSLKTIGTPAGVKFSATLARQSGTPVPTCYQCKTFRRMAEVTVSKLYTLMFACLLCLPVAAQDSTVVIKDTLREIPVDSSLAQARRSELEKIATPVVTHQQKRQRIKIVATANVLGYSAAMAGLYHAWYKDYPQGNFHVFNDIREWKQMDKLGHVYSAYAESKASMELWRWTGISRKKRIWLGGMSGAMYQTAIEVLDGFSTEWGWSWGDFAANVTGSGMLVAQELAWDEQRIQMKWSFHRKRYADPILTERSDDLFGESSLERFLKDYNGQTYWISTTLKPFFPDSRIPAWLQMSVGTGAEGLFGGYENIGKDKEGNISFSRQDIKRYRQWYLAPDIDLTKIKTNKKGVKLALQLLNVFKFPTPSLELSRGKISWNWIHF